MGPVSPERKPYSDSFDWTAPFPERVIGRGSSDKVSGTLSNVLIGVVGVYPRLRFTELTAFIGVAEEAIGTLSTVRLVITSALHLLPA